MINITGGCFDDDYDGHLRQHIINFLEDKIPNYDVLWEAISMFSTFPSLRNNRHAVLGIINNYRSLSISFDRLHSDLEEFLEGEGLEDIHLSDADLTDVNFSGFNLSNADLSGTNLTNANLSDTDLSNADLSNANLKGADLTGADLTDANLEGIITDENTKIEIPE